jgi:hypothetical protein
MLCTLSRWLISRAEDTGKALPRFAGRHVRRCRACAEFARTSATLSSRLRTERSAWLAGVPDFAVETRLDATPMPAAKAGPRESRRSWLTLRPLPVAAAAALVIVAGGFVLFQLVLKTPAPTAADRAAAMAALRTITSAPAELQGFVGQAESPLDRERRILENSVSSAVAYLQARLNIRIERREPPAKSS